MDCLISSTGSTKSIISQYELPGFQKLSSQLMLEEQCRANPRQGNEEALFNGRMSLEGSGPRPSRYGKGYSPTYQSIVVCI